MKKVQLIFLILPLLSWTMTACGGEEETQEKTEETADSQSLDTTQFLNDLAALEARLEDDLIDPEEEDLKSAITMFQDYAGLFPEDPKSPDYLFKASDISLTTGNARKSVKILDRIMNEYPNYERLEDVMFNKASHLDFELRDTTPAKEAYQTFIAKYPESELVDDAESRIVNIQYSLEELAEKFLREMEENPPAVPSEELP